MKKDVGLSMKYYVLNPYKRNMYGVASRRAIEAYADTIQQGNWDLAQDLRAWVKGIRLAIGEKADQRLPTDLSLNPTGAVEPSPERMVRVPVHIEKAYIED